MKAFAYSLFLSLQAMAMLPPVQVNKLANAIYIVEGGNKTVYPYGIVSINTRGNPILARTICINTIQNTHNRWLAANKPIAFLDYLADRYCPVAADRIGNRRWKVNIKKLVATK